jgi:hypothetical protein
MTEFVGDADYLLLQTRGQEGAMRQTNQFRFDCSKAAKHVPFHYSNHSPRKAFLFEDLSTNKPVCDIVHTTTSDVVKQSAHAN